MRNIWTITRREYSAYFASPIAYALAVIILLTVGVVAWANVATALTSPGFVPGVDWVMNIVVFVLVFTVPALTMRLLANETRQGTLELLLTSPVRDHEVIVGKWLGALFFLLTLFAFTLVFPLLLNSLVEPGIDFGPIWSSYLGLTLVSSAFIAIGLLISSLFTSLVATFITSMGALFISWFLLAIPAQMATGWVSDAARFLDMREHFNPMIRGVVDLQSVIYLVSVTVFFLVLSTVSLESRRWR